jgi:hypothetical protein
MTSLSVAGLRSISIKLVLVHTPVPLYLVPAPVSAQVPALKSVHRRAWTNTIECGYGDYGTVVKEGKGPSRVF